VWKERERELRLANDPGGVADALRGMGQGVTAPVTEAELATLMSPTILLAGADDPPYVAAAEHVAGVLPKGRVVIHSTAGHSLLSEDPGWVAMHVRRGLS
jgi:2-succinyl-6-hydroxy-2,4-cyclohexadiene-1-carboxylate synthase